MNGNFHVDFSGDGEDISTEIFQVGTSSQWREVSNLPYSVRNAAATTINNIVYLVGKMVMVRGGD